MEQVDTPEISDEALDAPLRDPVDQDNPPDHDLWRQRAKKYDSQYKGPSHWVWAINVIAATGNMALACREAGITTRFMTRRRERYPEFGEAVFEALQHFREGTLERAAHSRAVDGWLEPVYYKGEEIGHVRRYSDTLLNKLLEANIPEKYRSKHDNSAPGNITITGGLPEEPDDDLPVAAAPAADAPADKDDPLA